MVLCDNPVHAQAAHHYQQVAIDGCMLQRTLLSSAEMCPVRQACQLLRVAVLVYSGVVPAQGYCRSESGASRQQQTAASEHANLKILQ